MDESGDQMPLANCVQAKDSSSPSSSANSTDPLKKKNQPLRTAVPSTVWVIGFMMFLINVSYIIIYSLSALFLNTSLGVSTIWIGLLEGAVETVSYLMKLCSGIVSDYLRRRKFLMVIGYTLTVISKPILALSSSFFIVFTARLFERVGNGIQATPRDAMVCDISPPRHRGLSFGVMRSLGTAGSFLGGIIGFLAMSYFASDFQKVFWVATIPAALAYIILIFFVKESKNNPNAYTDLVLNKKADKRPIKLKDLLLLGKNYWLLMVVVAIFMLARISETLMVLHAHNNFGLDKIYAPLIMSLYNSTHCLSSFTSGRLSDTLGRRGVLIFGIGALVLSDLLLAMATSLNVVFIGIVIWGIQMGVSQNTFVSLIADYVPADLRGTGFGFYYLIGAVSSLLAGLGGGYIAHYFGVDTAFFASMIVAMISLVSLLFLVPPSIQEKEPS